MKYILLVILLGLILFNSHAFGAVNKHAGAKLKHKDYLWVCRYNVGPNGALKGPKLRKCMNYNLKVATEYRKAYLRMGLLNNAD